MGLLVFGLGRGGRVRAVGLLVGLDVEKVSDFIVIVPSEPQLTSD